MTQIIILEKKFITPLGLVRCGLKCNAIINKTLGTKIYENGKSEIFCTTSHKIELIESKSNYRFLMKRLLQTHQAGYTELKNFLTHKKS